MSNMVSFLAIEAALALIPPAVVLLTENLDVTGKKRLKRKTSQQDDKQDCLATVQ